MATSRVYSSMHVVRAAARARSINSTLVRRPFAHPIRQYASEVPPAASSSGRGIQALVGGLAGGTVAIVLGYSWYRFSGAKSAMDSVRTTTKYMESAKKQMVDSAPDSNEALSWLRQTAQTYGALVPGGKAYIDAALNDLDTVREKHGREVDDIVSKTYDEIKQITSSKGFSQDSAYQCFKAVENALESLAHLASDSAKEILDNHPQLKQYVGDDFEELKSMGQRWGPEAKEQVNKTYEQIQSTVSEGIGPGSIEKIRQLLHEKMDTLRKMRDDLFDRGMEKAKPYLEKSPKAKELIEKNKEALKQGDLATLWKKVRDAASSGNTEELEKYIKSSIDDTQHQSSSGSSSGIGGQLSHYLNLIPGGSESAQKLQRLYEIGQHHGKEAEDLLKSTVNELKQVLEKKVQEAEKIADQAANSK